ncbi:MAG: hypothetical protein ACTSVY_12355 [Candidatus Helarchaeota archaeon]
MDYIISYKFPAGVEQKYKSTIGTILKRTYEDKGLLLRLGYGKILIDHEYLKEEIKEKLIKNKAEVKVVEIPELSYSLIKKIEEKYKDSPELPYSIIKIIEKKYEHLDKIDLMKKMEMMKKAFHELYNLFTWIRDNRTKLLKDQKMYIEKVKTLDLELIDNVFKGGVN